MKHNKEILLEVAYQYYIEAYCKLEEPDYDLCYDDGSMLIEYSYDNFKITYHLNPVLISFVNLAKNEVLKRKLDFILE